MSLRLQRRLAHCFRTSDCMFIHWRPDAGAGLRHSQSGEMIVIRHIANMLKIAKQRIKGGATCNQASAIQRSNGVPSLTQHGEGRSG